MRWALLLCSFSLLGCTLDDEGVFGAHNHPTSTGVAGSGPVGSGGEDTSSSSTTGGEGGSTTTTTTSSVTSTGQGGAGGEGGEGGATTSTTTATTGVGGQGGEGGQPLVCSDPLADCNGELGDGCEVNTDTDILNCGDCDVACSFEPNSLPTCNGNCGFVCNQGFGDCSGAPGCETPLNTMQNCGACNNDCDPQTEACQNGACTSVICAPGAANCNANAADGCETSLGTVQNCTACGNTCNAPANAVATCNGSCGFTCNPGFSDCDGNPLNGCEVNLTSDPSHCGTCPTVCNGVNGTATCNGGLCGIQCAAGFENCNGSLLDGCEINKTTNLNNCGGCGVVCPDPANADPTCNGTCGSTCNNGYSDCDGNPANGCEQPTFNDAANCGACGHSCFGGTCSGGVCSQDITELVANIPASETSVNMAVDASNVFWTTAYGGNGSVRKVSKNGGPVTVLASNPFPSSPTAILVEGGFVFWSDSHGGNGGSINKTPVGGGATVVLGSGPTSFNPFHLASDGTYLYWLSSDGAPCYCVTPKQTVVKRVPIAGGAVSNLVTLVGESSDIAVDSTNVYVTSYGTYNAQNFNYPEGRVWIAPKAGGANSFAGYEERGPANVVTNGTQLFWIASHVNNIFTGIRKFTIGESYLNVTTISPEPMPSLPTTERLVLNGTGLYFIKETGPTVVIRKASTVGAPTQDIALNQGGTNAIAVDATHVYWAMANMPNTLGAIRKAPK